MHTHNTANYVNHIYIYIYIYGQEINGPIFSIYERLRNTHTHTYIYMCVCVHVCICTHIFNNGTQFELHILKPFHFEWHWTRVMDSCGFKVMYGAGDICDYIEPVLSSFHYSTKKYVRWDKIFRPALIKYHSGNKSNNKSIWESKVYVGQQYWTQS